MSITDILTSIGWRYFQDPIKMSKFDTQSKRDAEDLYKYIYTTKCQSERAE